MRTTVTLEDNLAAKLRERGRKRNLSFKQMVNDAVRHWLQQPQRPPKTKRFRVKPFSMGVKPGIDYDKINQFLDDEEIDYAVARF